MLSLSLECINNVPYLRWARWLHCSHCCLSLTCTSTMYHRNTSYMVHRRGARNRETMWGDNSNFCHLASMQDMVHHWCVCKRETTTQASPCVNVVPYCTCYNGTSVDTCVRERTMPAMTSHCINNVHHLVWVVVSLYFGQVHQQHFTFCCPDERAIWQQWSSSSFNNVPFAHVRERQQYEQFERDTTMRAMSSPWVNNVLYHLNCCLPLSHAQQPVILYILDVRWQNCSLLSLSLARVNNVPTQLPRYIIGAPTVAIEHIIDQYTDDQDRERKRETKSKRESENAAAGSLHAAGYIKCVCQKIIGGKCLREFLYQATIGEQPANLLDC